MEELVKYVISSLVDDEGSFEVKTVIEGDNTVINIIVDKKEIGTAYLFFYGNTF